MLFNDVLVQLNDYVHIGAIVCVDMGNDVLIASRVFISDHSHGRFDGGDPLDTPMAPPSLRPLSGKPVRIGNRVWIVENVFVKPVVSICERAFIGAEAIVTCDIRAFFCTFRVLHLYNPVFSRWEEI
jgi:lipopolysaccharide O-acetyltransferase